MPRSPDSTVASIGEFGLIDLLRRLVPTGGPGAVLGAGADPAALRDAGRVVTRAGARPGDGVWITGTVGKAAAGRYLAQHPGVRVPGGAALVGAFRRPTPRVQAGGLLGQIPAVSAMIDTSD